MKNKHSYTVKREYLIQMQQKSNHWADKKNQSNYALNIRHHFKFLYTSYFKNDVTEIQLFFSDQ